MATRLGLERSRRRRRARPPWSSPTRSWRSTSTGRTRRSSGPARPITTSWSGSFRRRPAGRERWDLVTRLPLRDRAGALVGHGGDLPRRHRTEAGRGEDPGQRPAARPVPGDALARAAQPAGRHRDRHRAAEVAARGRQHPAVSRHPRAAVGADGRAPRRSAGGEPRHPEQDRAQAAGARSALRGARGGRLGAGAVRGSRSDLHGGPRRRAALDRRRPLSPPADPGQPPQQRRQVHAEGWSRQLAGRARRTARRCSVSRTTASASPRRWPSRSSSSSSSRSGRSTDRAAAWASGSRWCGRSSTCTAGPCRCTARAKGRDASSWSGFPCRTGGRRRSSRQRGPPVLPAASLREGATIVVVEDQADSREALCELLSQEGFACRTAENGAEGLALIDEVLPDVAILDVGLPGMDGFEIARRLRADPRHAGMFLIALDRVRAGRRAGTRTRGRLRRAPRQAGERRGVLAAAGRAERQSAATAAAS